MDGSLPREGIFDYPQSRYAMRMLGESWIQPTAGNLDRYLHSDGEFRVGITLETPGDFKVHWSTNLISWNPFGSIMNGTGTYHEVSIPAVFDQMYFQMRSTE